MDLTRKARFCANGNEASTPPEAVYSSVVSRDSVRLAFLIAALNDLQVLVADVTNAYLYADVKEKIWFVGGLECGEGHKKVCVLTKALYGLKSSGNAWRTWFATTLEKLGFRASKADRDVWLRAAKGENGFRYYEMIFVYVDDILVLSKNAKRLIDAISEVYELKKGSGEEPTTYLGATIEKMITGDGREVWTMSPSAYLANAVRVVESLLADDGKSEHLRGKSAKTPFPTGYRPETDLSNELGPELATRFQQLIGIARWAIELGAIDIYLEVSMLSQHQALPREGHLEALYHIFAYVRQQLKFKKRIVFDPATVDVTVDCQEKGWEEFYPDAREEIPSDLLEPLGNAVRLNCFVDANHAGNVVTRRSHTGILIFVQNALIIWFSKRQNTVESSSFGSEFIALRIAKELIVALRYKLRSFGVPIVGVDGEPDGPALVHCDNQGVVANTSSPISTLSKKHVSINYHSVREGVAAGILAVSKEQSDTNLADAFTKVLPSTRRHAIFRDILY